MKKITLCLFLMLCTISGFAQKALHRKAEKCFNRFEFVAAAHMYEKIVRKNSADQYAWARLAHCYRALNYRSMEKLQALNLASVRQSASLAQPIFEDAEAVSGSEK